MILNRAKRLVASLLWLCTGLFLHSQPLKAQTNAVPDAAAIENLKAAAQKDPQAQYQLGQLYANGLGVRQDFKQAVYWFKKAADEKVADAQYSLGFCYATGAGVSRSMREAASCYRKAAEQGHGEAQYKLAVCYDKGLGVSRNAGDAMKWYRKAAEQGIAEAQAVLGHEAMRAKNYEDALNWFSKASVRGLATAQYQLGILYRNGPGTIQRDLAESYKWFLIAADNGSEQAMEDANDLRTMKSWGLTAAQAALGEQRARETQQALKGQK